MRNDYFDSSFLVHLHLIEYRVIISHAGCIQASFPYSSRIIFRKAITIIESRNALNSNGTRNNIFTYVISPMKFIFRIITIESFSCRFFSRFYSKYLYIYKQCRLQGARHNATCAINYRKYEKFRENLNEFKLIGHNI